MFHLCSTQTVLINTNYFTTNSTSTQKHRLQSTKHHRRPSSNIKYFTVLYNYLRYNTTSATMKVTPFGLLLTLLSSAAPSAVANESVVKDAGRRLSAKASKSTPQPTSDKRLKRNIAFIGNSPSGIPTYTFKYREGMNLANGYTTLDTVNTFVGAMAQDLLELAPEAVIMNQDDGYYRVDYSKIDVDFYKL